MRVVYLACGDSAYVPAESEVRTYLGPDADVDILHLPEHPSRRDLTELDRTAKEILPVDPTPSLEEIAKRPDIAHLGAPATAPQRSGTELRVVVAGTDGSLSAVLTRMMRGDYLWATVAYIPADPSSPAATNWRLPGARTGQLALAFRGRPNPAPVIRNDAGVVVAGSASVTAFDGGAFEGEIIVDDDTLVQQQIRPDNVRFFSQFGARLIPTVDAPGIAAMRLMTPPSAQFTETPARGVRAFVGGRIVRSIGPQQAQSFYETPALRWLVSHAPVTTDGVDPRTLLTGRALQGGGNRMLVTVDAVAGTRPVDRVTFYRHLRDLQIVRP